MSQLLISKALEALMYKVTATLAPCPEGCECRDHDECPDPMPDASPSVVGAGAGAVRGRRSPGRVRPRGEARCVGPVL